MVLFEGAKLEHVSPPREHRRANRASGSAEDDEGDGHHDQSEHEEGRQSLRCVQVVHKLAQNVLGSRVGIGADRLRERFH